MPYLIVEYTYDPPLTDEKLAEASAALNPCLDVRGIRRLRTYLSTDRRRGFCEFVAADAESLREAFHTAKVPYARLWAADLFGPP
ncbi:MAG TPA: nickel-binding protein [Polyangia bacterium]|nr:nickel-binding protein [Polyangia bacterium]